MSEAPFSPGITFKRESIGRLREDGIEAMLLAHWEEVAHDKDAIPLCPNWDRYHELDATGVCACWGLRLNGKLIGYTAFIIERPLHYMNHVFALNDVVYIQPRHRGIDGLVMILETAKQLRERRNVTKVLYHTKADAFLGDGDSLEALERALDIEEHYGVKVPDDAPITNATLADVLAAIGYRHVESTYGLLLGS